jgi:hypothetical protein
MAEDLDRLAEVHGDLGQALREQEERRVKVRRFARLIAGLEDERRESLVDRLEALLLRGAPEDDGR